MRKEMLEQSMDTTNDLVSPASRCKSGGTLTPEPHSPDPTNTLKVDEATLVETVRDKLLKASEQLEKHIERCDQLP